jgi:hypothetical protein
MYTLIHFLKFKQMKKIFTLLFAVGMVTLSQAQPGNRDNRQPDQRDFDRKNDKVVVVVNDHSEFDRDYNSFEKGLRFDDRISPERNIAVQIARINREYDLKIMNVKRTFFLSRWEKQRKIEYLEDQRQWEIKMVYKAFKNKRSRYNDNDRRYNDNDRRYNDRDDRRF